MVKLLGDHLIFLFLGYQKNCKMSKMLDIKLVEHSKNRKSCKKLIREFKFFKSTYQKVIKKI
jgi:hypothetical protein